MRGLRGTLRRMGLFATLALMVWPLAQAQDIAADEHEVSGNLTVSPSGVLLQSYHNAATGYSAGAGLSAGGLFLDGYQVGANGTIINGTGVLDGDDAFFNALTAGGITLGGGLNVGGTLHVQNSLRLGTWWNGSAEHAGLTMNFVDDGDANSGQVYFTSAAPQTTWSWEPNQGLVTLDANGNFSLTDNSSGNTVTMVPGNFSFVLSHNGTVVATVPVGSIPMASTIFASDGTATLGGGNIVIEGAGSSPSVTLGNYSLGTNSGGGALVLSASGSSQYIALDAISQMISFSNGFSIGGNSTQARLGLGNLGLAVGANSAANAMGAVALGGSANASGANAIALAGGAASGNSALAVGNGSLASGDNAVALGGGQASGNGAVALGVGSVAQAARATVLGHYNQPVSAAFVVGSGANSTAAANALVISNDGTTTLSGNATLTDASHQLQVNGASTFNGTTTFGGNVSLPQPLGDIPMGPFGRP